MEKLSVMFLGLAAIFFGLSCVKNFSYRMGYAKGKYDAFNMMGHIENIDDQDDDEEEIDNPPPPGDILPDEEKPLSPGVEKI